jgi:serine/threonine-protein kinase
MAVFDWGEDAGTPFLITEYLAGGSLRTILDRGRQLTPSQALLVGLQAARGLDFAHRRGLVHRDIKPANLLFDDDARLRIADFGLARALAEAAWTEPAGAVLGTARYAAPEQVKGSSLDGKADVYALAVVLVEAVTGQVPFAADTTIATLMARVDRPLDVPESLGPLRETLAAAGQPEPADRPDAASFAAAFDLAARDMARPEALPLAGSLGLDETAVIVPRDPTNMAPARPRADLGGPTVVHDRVEPMAAAAAAGGRRRRWRWLAWVLAGLVAFGLGAGVFIAATRSTTPTHVMPQVENLALADATTQLHALKLRTATRHVRIDGTTAGIVVHQSVLAKQKVKEGSTVTLDVSDGPTLHAVPAVASLTTDAAKNALTAAGFVPNVTTKRFDDKIVADVVLDWAPKGDHPKGTKVDLVVSAGPRRVPTDLKGKTFAAAQAQLKALGLTAVALEDYTDDVQAGQVYGSDPPPGSPVSEGAQITLKVSKGKLHVQVPSDIIGMTADQARARLAQVGLVMGSVYGPNGGSRRVFATNPSPGATLPRGSAVDVFVR